METRRDDFDLAAELRALRPSPSVDFAEELDARVVAGFAGERSEGGLLGRIVEKLPEISPRRLVLPVGAVALTAIVVATAVIAIDETENDVSTPRQMADTRHSAEERNFSGHPSASSGGGQAGFEYSDTPRTAAAGRPPGAEKAASGAGLQRGVAPTAGVQRLAAPAQAGEGGSRDVERDAELVLSAQAGEIGEASEQVFDAVHAVDGIVLSSSVEDRGADASADFELLIPSARLSDALASLSRIADVSSRRESTRDITAPTGGVEEQLADSTARIDGLLSQLASAESEEERGAVEAELRDERKRAAVLHAQLDQLRRRADFAEVSLRIESSAAGAVAPGPWGVGDALDDAGRILAIAAGVALVGLALLAPVALLALLAWLAQRIWLRQRRERALG